jgi:hypothetical protein
VDGFGFDNLASTPSAFLGRGRREQELKKHNRHALAMTFLQLFLRSLRLCDRPQHALLRSTQSKGLNLRSESKCDSESYRIVSRQKLFIKLSSRVGRWWMFSNQLIQRTA